MAGITDSPFRSICARMGCGLTYTEMISARGLFHGDRKTGELLRRGREEPYYAVQIFGSQPDIIARAVEMVQEWQPVLIDINMGCPAPKIVKNGDGCALMKQPSLAGCIVESAVRASPIPVSVKIRSGWDQEHRNAPLVARIAQESGASLVTIHPRTRDMLYGGKADWSMIRKVKESVDIPVFGSGDLFSPKDALDMMEQTGCDGVMVARGARGNPWIFLHLLELLSDKPLSPITQEEKIRVLKTQMMLMEEEKGLRGVLEMRKHASWYIKGEPHAARVKEALYRATSYREIEEAMDWLCEPSAGENRE